MNFSFLLLLLLLDRVDTFQVLQSPLDLVLHSGSPMKISCSVTGRSSPNIYWYRWTLADGLHLVFSSIVAGIVNPPTFEGFSASRPNDSHLVLESAGAEQAAPAVWDRMPVQDLPPHPLPAVALRPRAPRAAVSQPAGGVATSCCQGRATVASLLSAPCRGTAGRTTKAT
ncbi:hypothetical protein AAFF_G00386960 [Aldrovandia affinis]|uniref:Ig-like domain-containing protein n=1 Tax=Aldrovandia affinis TaxID=143900 RepID=A0AAD7WM49_9TELE|nr:hypothetical protein AAFF_G00386960 [Aldrovandia affinis]